MNWTALLAGIVAGGVVGTPVGWLTAKVVIWFEDRKAGLS